MVEGVMRCVPAVAASAGIFVSSLAGDVRRVAIMLEQAGTYLQSADAEQLIGDAAGFSHQRRWVFAAVALVASFALSRITNGPRDAG